MERISPISPALTQYQTMQDNKYFKDLQRDHSQDENEDNDTFERSTYSPYQMYDEKGRAYNNCIARRIISGNY